ncbi:hypothetical protein QJS10_CPB11g00743 [Acorus calamus]|uniref:Aminotransferase-like plant mobile domain-containing protein n=1 Tax=Acorus calamus TaxID=4465 RepID=A0AAV9DS05_ACOCL|nr:hypothetical protein QJS10_CPB11g00743 [Acorus calamus]
MAPKEHVRPTTSNKKNRSKDASKDTTSSSQNVVEEPQEEEVVAEEVEEDSEIDEASLKGPFPGGPVNNELLVDYRHHVAYHIWNGKERSVLRCRQPVTQLDSWSLDDEAIIFVNRVRESGLLPLVQWSFKTINCSLISAMVERWHPETNTFHLPVGEMGITLDDVHQITGIPVMGQAVSKPQIENFDAAVELVRDTLHIDPSNIVSELATSNGRSVRLSWLKEHLATKSRMMPQHTIECAVRGYLLYLLGCTIFSDKTGTHVSVEYLQFLLDLKKAWVYEYIPLLRPVQDDRVTQGFPRAALWKNSRNFPGLQKNIVIVIRELLDSLTREQRVMIAEYLQPLVQGRYTSDVLQRYMQNIINYCQDSTPLPTLTPPSTSIKERHNKRGIGRPSQH